ncbi:carbohydrate ABC transporter permease [uncultured Sphaerochaeta sp.]|uniref:carbohydrate ABC transporter permease n=1 Tax=uncultured Sphaerochaeta sp. TaxID=886478 RepID=UPI002A0A44C0|nr:carbohydrate ABC transporter permease [uncultured Sphaerochaeta sp.]
MSTRSKTVWILPCCLMLLSLVVIVPLYMIVINSFKPLSEASRLGLGMPSQWNFDNYKSVFGEGNILQGYLNNLIIGGISIFQIVLFGSMAAYVLQRWSTKLTNFLYFFFVSGLVIPVAIVPTIKTLMDLHIHNTYRGMIAYYTAILLPFTIFLITSYIKTIPREMDESGLIDGCSYPGIFFKIIFPTITPVLITAGLISLINVWNDFMGPFYLLSDSSKWTVTISVYKYIGKYGTKWNLVFADVVAVITPILLIYFFLQKYIVSGMTAGAIKG